MTTEETIAKTKPSSKPAKQSVFRVLERQEESMNPSTSDAHYKKLLEVSRPHIDAFNSIFSTPTSGGSKTSVQTGGTGGSLIELAVNDIPRVTCFKEGSKIEFWLSSPSVGVPIVEKLKNQVNQLLFPSECREGKGSYKAKFQVVLNWRVDSGPVQTETRVMGMLPVMVMSAKCNLNKATPNILVQHHEDPEEFGGYFITNGIERLIRLLIVPRRNHPTMLFRPSFMNRGPTFTKFGVQIRSVRPDQTSQSLTLHYCSDGNVNLRFSFRKNEYMVPVLLIIHALATIDDKSLVERITMGDYRNTFLTDRVEMLVRGFRRFGGLYDRERALAYLGGKFAVMLDSPEDSTERDVGVEFLKRVVLVHLTDGESKIDLLMFAMVLT